MKAMWNGKVIAESGETVSIEGNHYFPESSVDRQYLKDSATKTVCPWKGTASYYSISAEGKDNEDAAWCYPDPKEGAKVIKGRFAFWKGVEVVQ